MAKEFHATVPLPVKLLNRQVDPEWIGTEYSPDCENVYSKDGKIKTRPGYATFATNTLAGVPMASDEFYLMDGTKFLMAVSTTKVNIYDTVHGDWDDITGAGISLTADADDCVSSETMTNLWIFTNYVDAIYKWPGTGDIAVLGGSPPKAKILFKYQNHLILGYTNDGVTVRPQGVAWSDAGLPETWTGGSSGSTNLVEGVDFIQNYSFIDQLAYIYKERSIVPINYTGNADAPFDFTETKFRGTGLAAPRAIVRLGGYDIFFGWDNLYKFDGFSAPVALGSMRISKWLVDNISPTYQNRAFMHWVEELAQVWFFFPSTASAGYCDTVLVYGLDEDMFTIYRLTHNMTCGGYYERVTTDTIDSVSAAIDSVMTAIDSRTRMALAPTNLLFSSAGQAYQIDYTAVDDAGTAFTSYFWSEDFTF